MEKKWLDEISASDWDKLSLATTTMNYLENTSANPVQDLPFVQIRYASNAPQKLLSWILQLDPLLFGIYANHLLYKILPGRTIKQVFILDSLSIGKFDTTVKMENGLIWLPIYHRNINSVLMQTCPFLGVGILRSLFVFNKFKLFGKGIEDNVTCCLKKLFRWQEFSNSSCYRVTSSSDSVRHNGSSETSFVNIVAMAFWIPWKSSSEWKPPWKDRSINNRTHPGKEERSLLHKWIYPLNTHVPLVAPWNSKRLR